MSDVLDDIACKELVELVTAYFEGALEVADRQRFEAHLEICDGCRAYVEQMREVARLSGRVTPGALDPEMRDGLLKTFREWTQGREAG
jgi:anti-sigma factor RsiW